MGALGVIGIWRARSSPFGLDSYNVGLACSGEADLGPSLVVLGPNRASAAFDWCGLLALRRHAV